MPKHHTIKVYSGVEVHFNGLLTSAPNGCVINFTLCPLYPQRKSPRYPSDRGLGGPQRPLLIVVSKRKIEPLLVIESWSL